MFRDILRVGALACLSPVQTALAALLLTGMVARLGPLALAGYGIGQRLEFLLIPMADRKSTRLNSSHLVISYAVFCLKKKKPNCLIWLPRTDCDRRGRYT